jgi:RimJ/RimL family protein N-acetyltransferase
VIPRRLVPLRPIEPADLGLLQHIANDARIEGSFVGWGFPVGGHSHDAWLKSARADPRTARLMIESLADEGPVGLAGLWEIDWHNRSAMTATSSTLTAYPAAWAGVRS